MGKERPKDLKLYHYRLYDDKRRPVVSVCLSQHITPNGRDVYCRGIAICAPLDYGNLRVKRGYAIARGRCMAAIDRLDNGIDLIRRRAVQIMFEDIWRIYNPGLPIPARKSQYDITPSANELDRIQKRQRVRNIEPLKAKQCLSDPWPSSSGYDIVDMSA